MRGKYVSVELVREVEDGLRAEWRMATSSDAGGNIPRFMTNGALSKSIAEDVPSFLRWMMRRYDWTEAEGGTPQPAAGATASSPKPTAGAAASTPEKRPSDPPAAAAAAINGNGTATAVN